MFAHEALTVSAHTFYFDPSHRRPIPPELFQFLLEVEGFTGVEVRTYAPSDPRRTGSKPLSHMPSFSDSE